MSDFGRRSAIPLSQTMISGLVMAAIGALALLLSRKLSFGSLAEIGPGFFPSVLAAILILIGIVLMGQSIVEHRQGGGEALERWSVRQIASVLGAVLLFGMTIRGMTIGPLAVPALGLLAAVPLALLFAGMADRATRWRDLVILAVVLTAGTTLLFRFILGLPIPVAPWLIGY